MRRPLLILCAAALTLAQPLAAQGGGRTGARKTLKWHNYKPKGLGIQIAKPVTLKMKKRPAKSGYLALGGTESITKTQLTLYVRKAGRTAAQLKADLKGLTGVAVGKMLPLMNVGAVRGFSWQHSFMHRSANGMATGVLLARHAKRALSYVLVVRVQLGVGMKHLADFKKAYLGLKAI